MTDGDSSDFGHSPSRQQVPSLAQLAADAVMKMYSPRKLRYKDGDCDYEDWSPPNDLSEFELGVVVQNASTQLLATRAWPVAREELIHRLSLVSPESPMALDTVFQVECYFETLGIYDEVKSLLDRAQGIAMVMEENCPLPLYTAPEGVVSYLEENPDGLPESDVRRVLEHFSGVSTILALAEDARIIVMPALSMDPEIRILQVLKYST